MILVCVKLKIKANMSILVVFLIAHKSHLQEKMFIVDHSSENYSPSEQRKHGRRSGLVSSPPPPPQRAEKGEWQSSEGWVLFSFPVWNPRPIRIGFSDSVNSLWKYPHRHTQGCALLAVLLDSIKLTIGINHHNVKNQFGNLLLI